MPCLSPSPIYIYKSFRRYIWMAPALHACGKTSPRGRRTGAEVGKMETNLAEILMNQPIRLFADVGWFHAFQGLLFPVLFFVCCGGRWHELGRRTTAKLFTPRRSLGKGRLQDTQGSSWGPDPCVTTLLLSCPIAPGDLAACCSF